MLTNQMMTATTQDLLLATDKLFDRFVVPLGVDRELAIDTIIKRVGLTPLYHPDPNWIQFYIGRWSAANLSIWEKLYKTTQLSYDPISNYDRNETVTDSRTTSRTASEESTASGNQSIDTNDSSSMDAEHKLSADNSDSYEPGTTDTSKTAGTSKSDSSSSSESGRDAREDGTESYTHNAHIYGNIGVTTTQQMIDEERRSVRFNIYNEIADSYKDEFCLYVY